FVALLLAGLLVVAGELLDRHDEEEGGRIIGGRLGLSGGLLFRILVACVCIRLPLRRAPPLLVRVIRLTVHLRTLAPNRCRHPMSVCRRAVPSIWMDCNRPHGGNQADSLSPRSRITPRVDRSLLPA